ncbi:hypothetical protein [Erythrobacter sp. BLCC-B19]|uniref:hypothetical protein n=1 Tax=Erythrobacter sp. BLCC-B19 TaxID=3025315 RepID=UPI002360F43D|nr:hypothetical protein [Erythrobacter sp. BLCC-B19]WDA42557.1 hypothetical protein PS060_07025 [Erythrobacter sp. BLCC-B19]
MSLLSSIACGLNQHQPLRRDVTWNGRAYVGNCRHCGVPIERHGHRNWRKRGSAADGQHGAPTPTPT